MHLADMNYQASNALSVYPTSTIDNMICEDEISVTVITEPQKYNKMESLML